MANLKFNTTLRNNRLQAINDFVGAGGLIKIYTGTQPAGGGTATTLLVTLTCDAADFAQTPSGGQMTLNGVTGGTIANNGTGTWFRLETSGGTFVMDGDITTTGGNGDMELDSTSFVAGGTASLSGPNIITEGNPG